MPRLPKKQAILVVGTGRSGTSVMTGTLQLLGACLGEELKRGDAWNPKGYFENTQITDLNKRALSEVGMSWYDSSLEIVRPVPMTSTLSMSIRNRVSAIFGERSPIAIKDPRLCVLLDAYVSTLREMGYETHCVRMLRDPIEVASSLTAVAGGSVPHWLPKVVLHAELLDAALKRTAVDCIDCSFTDLVACTKGTISALMERLPFLACTAERMNEISGFIDGSLKHYVRAESA